MSIPDGADRESFYAGGLALARQFSRLVPGFEALAVERLRPTGEHRDLRVDRRVPLEYERGDLVLENNLAESRYRFSRLELRRSPAAPPPSDAIPVVRVNVGHDGPELPLPADVVWQPQSRKVLLETDRDVSLVVSGDGEATAQLSGYGAGHVARVGSGRGSARRTGFGYGNAVRSGAGDGNAVKELGDGDAVRTGDGRGAAVNASPGCGHARRLGSGEGDAQRRDGIGNASRVGTGSGSASHHARAGRASRAGVGDGTAVVGPRDDRHPGLYRPAEFGVDRERLDAPVDRLARACVYAAFSDRYSDDAPRAYLDAEVAELELSSRTPLEREALYRDASSRAADLAASVPSLGVMEIGSDGLCDALLESRRRHAALGVYPVAPPPRWRRSRFRSFASTSVSMVPTFRCRAASSGMPTVAASLSIPIAT